MLIPSIIISVLFALIFASLLSYGFKRKGPGPFNGNLFFFVIIFMFTIAVGSWLVPIEPLYWNVSWIGYFFVAFVLMLLLGVILPPRRPRNRLITKSKLDEEIKEEETVNAVGETFGVFFWLMVIILFVLFMYKLLG